MIEGTLTQVLEGGFIMEMGAAGEILIAITDSKKVTSKSVSVVVV